MDCSCRIVPRDILEKLAADPDLSPPLRSAAAVTAKISSQIRKVRNQAAALTSLTTAMGAVPAELAPAPLVTVYDCKHGQSLPGSPLSSPGGSSNPTAARTFKETTSVAEFYKKIFNRNSIDNAGMTLMSSIHYGSNYNNAMWNGSQMIYGDGDNQIFIDFTRGNDVIGHELTHGLTQHTLELVYSGDAGGLNESISDCFGSMFRQWQANQDAHQADWLIGHGIMGPIAAARGFTCLRDMGDPAAAHCLAAQPTKYSQITPGMDPHYSSGPPNLAFCLACKKVGGPSWKKVGQVWYRVMTTLGPSPNLKMKAFAKETRKLAGIMFPAVPTVAAGVDYGWKQVGL
ncbi:MAG: M4 family metallopeptidase [Pyrinomonadaceae bacterium]